MCKITIHKSLESDVLFTHESRLCFWYVSLNCSIIIVHVSSLGRLISKMLIREPNHRSTLEDITVDPWLRGAEGDSEQLAEMLPLVSREHLSEEDHAHILHKMVAGNIAAIDQILE